MLLFFVLLKNFKILALSVVLPILCENLIYFFKRRKREDLSLGLSIRSFYSDQSICAFVNSQLLFMGQLNIIIVICKLVTLATYFYNQLT